MKFRSIKGVKDILPIDVAKWQHIEKVVRQTMHNFNYKEIRTPIFEQTGLFCRSIGELTDIVSKEMYTFLDRSQESITLRPEGTAATLRAYIQNNLAEQSSTVKLYYIGPMFRQERPQAGRFRQFHQFGAEALGTSSPIIDVEAILLPITIYDKLGIKDQQLKINSVGCEKCRPAYKNILQNELRKIADKLSEDSKARIEQNPLRVLDSKSEIDIELTQNMPLITDNLCEECKTHFEKVCSILDELQIKYKIDARLVRGLDYYTKTAFEISSADLGSQDALAGGGRYDLLVSEIGGNKTPGVGFAAGIERLIMVLEKLGKDNFTNKNPDLYFVTFDEKSNKFAFVKSYELRNQGITTEIDYQSRSIKAQMREANKYQARYVIVIGEEELKTKRAKLKNMSNGDEVEISLDNIKIPQDV